MDTKKAWILEGWGRACSPKPLRGRSHTKECKFRDVGSSLLPQTPSGDELEERLHQIGIFERPIAHFAHQCT